MPRDNYRPFPHPPFPEMPDVRFLFCDIDGVISNDWHRRDLLPKGSDFTFEDFEPYHRLLEKDTVNWDILGHLMKVRQQNLPCAQILLTSRPEYVRQRTENWLSDHWVHYSRLLMRGNTELTPPAELKIRLAEKYLKRPIADSLPRIVGVIDDDKDVCSAFASLGVPATYVRNRPAKGEIHIFDWRN